VRFNGIGTLGASLRVNRNGYYGFGVTNAEHFRYSSKELKGGVEEIINLRPVIEPIALYAKRTESKTYQSGRVPVPVVNDWCGYDLGMGDWVAPHGNGKVADFLLRFDREFVRFEKKRTPLDVRRKAIRGKYERLGKEFTEEVFKLEAGDWDIRLEIAFPGEKEGLIRVEDKFNPHSVLRMPHLAPEKGYAPDYTYSLKTYGESAWNQTDDVGFFLRTRVVLDEDGEIESANYAKVYGDFKIEQDGDLSFWYYFNPEVNDRNLEFDPDQNLFPEDTLGTSSFYLP